MQTMIHQRLTAATVLLALDLVWVTTVMRSWYASMVAIIQSETPMRLRMQWALVAYAFMVVGLLSFCVRDGDDLSEAGARGALFGLVLYGVYDFTNATVFKDFHVGLACIDVVWGSFVFGVASAAATLV